MFEFLMIISVSTLTKCFFMDLKYGAEYSGHTGLTFKEARPMESEKTALKQLKDFPECLKEPLLKTIHQGKLKDITNFLEY